MAQHPGPRYFCFRSERIRSGSRISPALDARASYGQSRPTSENRPCCSMSGRSTRGSSTCPNSGQDSLRHSHRSAGAASARVAGWPQVGQMGDDVLTSGKPNAVGGANDASAAARGIHQCFSFLRQRSVAAASVRCLRAPARAVASRAWTQRPAALPRPRTPSRDEPACESSQWGVQGAWSSWIT